MNLIGLTYLTTVRPRGLPHFDQIDLKASNHALIGWRVLLKGPRVVFVKPGASGGAAKIFVVPRQHFAEWWEGDETELGKIDNWGPVSEDKGTKKP